MSDNKEYLDWCDRWDLHGKASEEAFEDAKDCAAQPVVLSDEQREAIRHAGALLELEGYADQSADLYAILAAKEQA
jgi:hypothetical protein